MDDLPGILKIVRERIKRVDERIHDISDADKDIRLLETIPSVGHVMAMTVRAEVGEIGRFSSPDALASYAGLGPVVRQSGEKKAHVGGMSKRGNPRLRYVLTEAVHVHVVYCKGSRLTSFYERKK